MSGAARAADTYSEVMLCHGNVPTFQGWRYAPRLGNQVVDTYLAFQK